MSSTFAEMSAIAERLNASPAAQNLMEAFPRVIQFTVADQGSPFFIRIEDGRIAVHDGAPNDPDLVVEVADAPRFIQVLHGRVDVSHPLAEGKLTLERGKVSEMILLNRILAAGQKRKAK